MRDKGNTAQHGKPNQTDPPSKQIIVAWTAAGINFLHEKPDFMVKGINSNSNGTDDHMICSETDIKVVKMMM